jgi:uncharacterized protein
MKKSDWYPYAAPMAAFLILTTLEGMLPRALYPYLYTLKAVLIAAVLVYFAPSWKKELRGDTKALVLGVLAGFLGLGLWLGLDALQPASLALGKRVGYNPFEAISSPAVRYGFIAVRFIGLALLVPVLEEVFWRSFLLRFLTDQDKWQSLPLEKFSLSAFAIVTAVFAAAHPEWLAGLGFAALMGGLLRHTKSLLACVIAHGVTNAALGVYVLITGNWQYW